MFANASNRGTDRIYGLVIVSIQHFIEKKHGRDVWNKILEHAGRENSVFTTHDTYPNEIMLKLAEGCNAVIEHRSLSEYLCYFGNFFVAFCSLYGYDQILRVSGRYYRDFLHEINNLHEIIRYSYPNMQSPTFIVEMEDKDGCILSYKSHRIGFSHYVIGQLDECARMFFNVDVEIKILNELVTSAGTNTKYRLNFNNFGFIARERRITPAIDNRLVTGEMFFKIFPFCILFDATMKIINVGANAEMLFKDDVLIGSDISKKFGLRRPLINFTWDQIYSLQAVIYEMETVKPLNAPIRSLSCTSSSACLTEEKPKLASHKLLLRGQMKYIDSWEAMAFLCSPLLNDVKDMEELGLCISDLNMFDSSRNMVLAGWQHAPRLEYLLEKQTEKVNLILENFRKVKEWKEKTDKLLYAMIPKSIAIRLKSGEASIKTCETFESVTIMFSYLVGFAEICGTASAMQVVECISHVFALFDKIVDDYDVFKVETLGDAVYMVAGGVPNRRSDHAFNVAGLALELVNKAESIKEPVRNEYIKIKIGIHSGSIVAGVVGKRMPQYCLFGDTVNTASRMQSYSEPGRIHLSEPCHQHLQSTTMVTVLRGYMNVKGKGEMKTYWLAGRKGEEATEILCNKLRMENITLKARESSITDDTFDFFGMHMLDHSTEFQNASDTEDEKIAFSKGTSSISSSEETETVPESIPSSKNTSHGGNLSTPDTEYEHVHLTS